VYIYICIFNFLYEIGRVLLAAGTWPVWESSGPAGTVVSCIGLGLSWGNFPAVAPVWVKSQITAKVPRSLWIPS